MREKKLFFQAMEITDPKQQEQFLAEACEGNDSLRNRIKVLLSAASAVGDFLEPAGSSDSIPSSASNTHDKSSLPATFDFLEPISDSKYLGRLAHYDVIAVLGHGAFGIVFKAFDRRLHRQVAIKVLSPQLATTSPPRKRFLREARSCAAIKHPNVVHLYEVSDKPTPYIVMEYVDSQTLQERIGNAGPLEISEVIKIAEQLATGLEAAHGVGLIHRDIKPSNILIEDKGQLRAVLTDFGLARAVDDASLTQSGVLIGTPIYMSPEQTKGQKLDARTDLFSLGSVLYVMITGRPPFRARNTVAALERVANSNARPITEIIPDSPEWLNCLVERLHEKDRAKRIQSATEALRILREQERTPKLPATPPGTTRNVTKESGSGNPSKSKWVWTGATVVFVFLIGFAAMYRPSKVGEATGLSQETGIVLVEQISDANLKEEEMESSEPHPKVIWPGWSKDAPHPAVTPFGPTQALQYQKEWAEHLNVPVEFTDKLGVIFRLIPPGEFTMGTSERGIQSRMHHDEHDEWWNDNLLSEAPQHRVAISEPYYLATTELTQDQFESIMSYNPANFQKGGEKWEFANELESLNYPMEGASWNEIQSFIERLNIRSGHLIKGEGLRIYRLPTEAEWEFACRGGTQTDFWTGNDEQQFLEHENAENQLGRTSKVGEYLPNSFGLYDIAGNVHEYVQDLWDARYSIALDSPITVDPTGPTETIWGSRVARGGDYWWWSYHSRSAYRIGIMPQERSGMTIGCRLALDVDSYSLASSWKQHNQQVSGFSEVHGANLEELKDWLTSIRGQYVPTRVNLRWGSSSLFDAVATSFKVSERDWQVNFFEDDKGAGRNFSKMRKTHDIYWKLLIPKPETHPLGCSGLKIWRQTGRNSATWNLGNGDLLTEINTASSKGALPMSLAYTESGNGKNSAYVQHQLPGVGNKSFVGLSLTEFNSQVKQHRQRNWRLHFFQFSAGTSELKINCVFCENLDRLDWEMSFDLAELDYERELHRRKFADWHPSCVGSYLDDGIPRYLVCWNKMKIVRSRGGFGGR